MNQTTTDSNGAWEVSFDIERIEEANESWRSVDIVLVAKKSAWFDSVRYHWDELPDTHELTLRREFLLERRHTDTEPTEETIDVSGEAGTYYGTVSVWREFSPNEPDLQLIHTMLHTASVRDQEDARPSARIKAGILSIQIPEDLFISRNPDGIAATPSPSDPSILPHTEPADNPKSITPGDELLASHTDANIEGPLSPAIGHKYLSEFYRSPKELRSKENERQVAATLLSAILGPIPYVGTALGTASAIVSVFQTLSDDHNTEWIQQSKMSSPNHNRYDSVTFGHDSDSVFSPFDLGAAQNDSFESMSFVTGIDWAKTEPNKTNITLRGLWKRTTDIGETGPRASAIAFGETISREPSLPWHGDEGKETEFTLTVTDSSGTEVGSATVSDTQDISDFGKRIGFATIGDFRDDGDHGIADFVRLGTGETVENWSNRSLSDYTMIKNGGGKFSLVSAPTADGSRALEMFTGPKATMYISSADRISIEPEKTVKVDLRHETDKSDMYAMKTTFGVGVDESGQGGINVRLINSGSQRTAGASIVTPDARSRIKFTPDLKEFYTFSIEVNSS